MKKILFSLAIILAVGGIVWGATKAFYNDTETSTGNIFTAGSVDLKVDHTYASYDGKECVGNCEEGDELIINGGFEQPNLSSGQWHVYTGTEVPGWEVVDGAGLEIQDHAAGNPHTGSQLAELDSHGAGSQSTIEQVINTIPGQKYRLSFWHSPRPKNGPDTDNAIRLKVLITSNSGTIVNDVVGQPSYSGSNTTWTKYTYNFIALDTQTSIQFGDAGSQQDTLGGYLDDVSVKTLTCTEDEYPYGGICTLWNEQDLGQEGSAFWNFSDIKPGDYGINVISLHDYGNDAYACLLPNNVNDDENVLINPEEKAGDNTPDEGELSGALEFFMWQDDNGNNTFDLGEPVLVEAGTPFNQIMDDIDTLSLVGNAPVTLVGIDWCAGTQSLSESTISCDGNGMTNVVQTDKMMADFVAYAVQQRNNEEFSCSQVQLED